jgi:GT2 family glycosyltransferase
MTDLSIIIVSYNTKDVTKECLASVKKYYGEELKKGSYELIVVDNASSDGTPEELEKDKDIKLIKSKENLGFSKGNNLGIKEAKGRYILFLNSDTVVNKDTLSVMVSFMEKNKEVGAATCKVLLPTGEIDDASHRGFPTPWNALMHFSGLSKIFPNSKIFNGYHMAWCDLDKNHPIDALAGAFMIVRREAGEEVGWWDEDYFFYGEDIDFCYMLKQKKWKVYFVADASVLHYKGVSGGIKKESEKLTSASRETKIRVTKWRFNAMKIFYGKHYVQKYPYFLTSLVMLAIEIKLRLTLRKI